MEQNRNETYDEVKRKLCHHFMLKQNKQHARYLFKRPENMVTISEYVMKLQEQAESCKFRDNREDKILERGNPKISYI